MEVLFFLALFLGLSLWQAAARRKKALEDRPEGARGAEAREPDLLAELRKVMEQLKEGPAQPKRLPAPAPLPAADSGATAAPTAGPKGRFVFERAERPMVDFDDQAEAVVARRLKWAADHGGALTAADHRAFDARIRKPAPKASGPDGGDRPSRLRQAIIWQEVLGKPVSLRGLER